MQLHIRKDYDLDQLVKKWKFQKFVPKNKKGHPFVEDYTMTHYIYRPEHTDTYLYINIDRNVFIYCDYDTFNVDKIILEKLYDLIHEGIIIKN